MLASALRRGGEDRKRRVLLFVVWLIVCCAIQYLLSSVSLLSFDTGNLFEESPPLRIPVGSLKQHWLFNLLYCTVYHTVVDYVLSIRVVST